MRYEPKKQAPPLVGIRSARKVLAMREGLVSVRYMVDDVDKAIAFYTKEFSFEVG